MATSVSKPRMDRHVPGLSPREQDMLACLARGMTNAEIARELYISIGTVKSHLSSLFAKLGVSNRTQAALSVVRSVPGSDHVDRMSAAGTHG